MQLYNTMTRAKEPLNPCESGHIGLYACGITAYDFCHIGHARSAIVFDVLVRFMRHLGLKVTFVRNFTDVDDKIINKANQENATSEEIAQRYIAAFHEDMDRLGVLRATYEPKATEHIGDMVDLCLTLIDRGYAYSTPSGDVYFRVRSFPDYGKLSGRTLDEMVSGARVAPGEEKEDPLDFALWKAAKPGEPYWDSPFGKGRPGWHIECSAMSEKYLPLPIDIHGGGQDLIFPHHENEIAQTEAATGKRFSRLWVHNGFVQINSEKMSKSLGNFKTIRDILEFNTPEALRFFLLARHYRSPVDFSPEAMEESERNLRRLYETLGNIREELARPEPEKGKALPELESELEELEKSWRSAMEDDLNTAAALGYVNSMFRLAGRILEDKGLKKNVNARRLLSRINGNVASWGQVLGILQLAPDVFLSELKRCKVSRVNLDVKLVEELMEKRRAAKEARDFAQADLIRAQLAALGVEVRDTPAGAVWDMP